MIEALSWYICVVVLGWIMIPFTIWWGKDLFLKGVMLSKLWGILFVTLLIWVLSNLNILPFTVPSLILIIGLLIFFNAFLLKKKVVGDLFTFKNVALILGTELFFLIPFGLLTYIRTFNPNIDNFEKFMDMNILSGLLRTTFFPPQDTWFAGETINYYYFGHLISATLTKLSGVPNYIGYNLATPTVFAFSFITAFTLVASFVKKITLSRKSALLSGIVGAILTTCGGTLHTFSFVFEKDLENFWFWRAIRLIPNAIHETPSYSFAVADLHAHMLNIPHVLLVMVCLFVLISRIQKLQHVMPIYYVHLSITGIVLGILIMTSAWDFPMYLGLVGMILFATYVISLKEFFKAMLFSMRDGFVILSSVIVTTFFFFKYFDSSIAGGVGLVHAHTSPLHFLILWGPHVLIIFPTLIWFVWQLLKDEKQKNLQHFLTKFFRSDFLHTYATLALTLLMAVWGFVLLMVPEILYLKDIYGDDMHRLNTILKFYYQAYIVLSITCSILISYAFSQQKTLLWNIWKVIVVIILIPLLIFPAQIIPAYYYEFETQTSLDGKEFMNSYMQEDKLAIEWIQENIDGQPVMVEAPGDSYTTSNRISTFTGLPTVVGWFVHEWLWRGSADKPGERNNDVTTLYENPEPALKRQIIYKYKIEYIYVGQMEKDKYPLLDMNRLSQLGTIAYQTDNVMIIKIE